MSLSEIAVFAIGFGILFSIISLIPSFHAKDIWARAKALSLLWLPIRKEEAHELLQASQKVAEPAYPTSWWTDESQYQLESRAIFSKVSSGNHYVKSLG